MVSKPDAPGQRPGDALAERLNAEGNCPIEALVRLARQAEAEGDMRAAMEAWKSLLPYVHAKPKAIETAPETVIELARAVASAREEARAPQPQMRFHDLLSNFAHLAESDEAAELEAARNGAAQPEN